MQSEVSLSSIFEVAIGVLGFSMYLLGTLTAPKIFLSNLSFEGRLDLFQLDFKNPDTSRRVGPHLHV